MGSGACRSWRVVGAAAGLLAAASCSPGTKTIPPLGEVLVVVDTDMPVPAFNNRLRVDLYDPSGTWYDSEDSLRANPGDWPTSFGLYVPGGASDGLVWVRIRAYPQGEVRDYRGERYEPRPSGGTWFKDAPVATPTDMPRLLQDDGTDVTPPTEPAPLLAIDRLIVVRVVPDVHLGVHVVLHGACVGTMADVVGENSCVDTENTLIPVTEEPSTPDTSLPPTSLQGTYDVDAPCTATPRPPGHAADGSPLYDDEVCVDGAMFIFGSNNGFGQAANDDVPRRVARLPPFRIDRYEVTVGRWRDALVHGFVPPVTGVAIPIANEGPLPTQNTSLTDEALCTWSTSPRGREDYPLNCITWPSARAFCQWAGGDFPTEAQWEYVTTDAGRAFQTPYPWGGDDHTGVSCTQAAYGRGPYANDDDCNPAGTAFGPVPVEAFAEKSADVSAGLGVVDLAGNMSEFMLDAFASFASYCWAGQPIASPACLVDSAPTNSLRGGNWALPFPSMFAANRLSESPSVPSLQAGFRCARPGT